MLIFHVCECDNGVFYFDVQPEDDISAYTYERTLMMQQRNALLAKMNLKKHSITVSHPLCIRPFRIFWQSCNCVRCVIRYSCSALIFKARSCRWFGFIRVHGRFGLSSVRVVEFVIKEFYGFFLRIDKQILFCSNGSSYSSYGSFSLNHRNVFKECRILPALGSNNFRSRLHGVGSDWIGSSPHFYVSDLIESRYLWRQAHVRSAQIARASYRPVGVLFTGYHW